MHHNINQNINMHTSIKTAALLFTLLTINACSPSNDNTTDKTTSQISPPVAKTLLTTDTSTDNFPYAFEKIAENTWVMHGPLEMPNPQNKGFMNNPGIVKTSAGLVVIDPGSTLQIGNNVLTEIKKISGQDIVAVFNTHIHGDHWLANQSIKAAYPNVKIYGHKKMLAEIENGEGESWVELMDSMTEGASKGTIVVGPNSTVKNDDIIKVGDTQFKIHHYGIAHTSADIMIEVVENSVIFLGDNVLTQRIPRTSDGTISGSIATIKTMLENNVKTYVPGHGPTGDKTMVENYLNYLTLIYAAAQKTFEEDLDSSDVLTITTETTAAYKNWPGYDDLLGSHGAQAYSEVEEAEF
ncbi:MBL-fold metallo-hydrolase superfamily [hydrothermal vent metagenome]|uniref:MBL-fold metallo-hydrolase superfamily n=1 Tax=hydrothermal vent metagenome TaxID=652676 RepID=A0A3B0WPN7_9ZZZZ